MTNTPKKTVLVVEDDPVNMKLALLLLRNAGYVVLCATDGETGLRLARSGRPDLILMDIHLPGIDGSAATTLLRQDPGTASIPVIALSAVVAQGERSGTQAAAFDAYVGKPLRYQELYAAIDRLLATGHPLPGAGVASFQQPQADEPAAERAVAAIDLGLLERLVGTDPAVVLDFLKSFRIGAAKQAPALKEACDAGQLVQAVWQAHKLRSSAYTVGARSLGALCAEMETAGKAGCRQDLDVLMPRFQEELAAVFAFVDALQPPQAAAAHGY
jgi:CheY-like chemotaxis protein/HPt (histidine-containing phosphotransfer) domain-containing protein